MAFEKEKSTLEDIVASIIGSERLLRSKYQISKHSESYEDLYSEAAQVVKETVHSLSIRTRLLEMRLQNARKLGILGQAAVVKGKTVKKIMRKIAESLEPQCATSALSHGAWYRGQFEKVTLLKKQIDELEMGLPVQTMLPLTAEVILSKITSHEQDVRTIIDLESAIASLSPESELAALLQLALSGEVMLMVRVEDSAM